MIHQTQKITDTGVLPPRIWSIPLPRASSRLALAPWLPSAWILLMSCSELKVTHRRVSEAAAGIPSIDNLIEMAIFGTIAVASLITLSRMRRRTRRSMGVPLLLAFGVLA